MARLRFNSLSTTLGVPGLTSSGTAVTFAAALTHAGGSVPTITGTDYIPLSILDSAGKAEIVYLTAYTLGATTGTITRAQEGSTAASHASGDKVLHGATALDFPRDQRSVSGSLASLFVDEFNGDTLDAAWVRVDSGAGAGRVAWSQGGDALSVVGQGGDAAAELHALVRPLSGFGGSVAVGDAFVTCLTNMGRLDASGGFPTAGLVLADGNTYGAGNQVAAVSLLAGSSGQGNDCRAFTNYNANSSAVGNMNTTPGTPTFVRLVMTAANTWRVDVSPNGVGWLLGTATLSKTVTPTHVGLLASSWGTGAAIRSVASYDFLRRYAGVS